MSFCELSERHDADVCYWFIFEHHDDVLILDFNLPEAGGIQDIAAPSFYAVLCYRGVSATTGYVLGFVPGWRSAAVASVVLSGRLLRRYMREESEPSKLVGCRAVF